MHDNPNTIRLKTLGLGALIISTILAVSTILGGCSSSGNSSDEVEATGSFRMLGTVQLEMETSQRFGQDFTRTDIDANFLGFTPNYEIDLDEYVSFLETLVYGDTRGCVDRQDLPAFPELPEVFTPPAGTPMIRTVSAGEVLTVGSTESSWPDLPFDPVEGSYYLVDGPIEGFPTTALTLDIPGDEFPAYTSTALPLHSPLLNMRIEGNGIESGVPSITTSWTPGADPQANVSLVITLQNSDNTGSVGVNCLVADTGSFTVPAEFATIFQGGRPNTFRFNMTREHYSYVTNGETALVLSTIVTGEL